jgi:hypothetical protein
MKQLTMKVLSGSVLEVWEVTLSSDGVSSTFKFAVPVAQVPDIENFLPIQVKPT